MLDYWDRACIYFSEKFNISKNKVSIILALVIVKFVALAIILVVLLCRNSKSNEPPESFNPNPNGSNDELILAQTVSVDFEERRCKRLVPTSTNQKFSFQL